VTRRASGALEVDMTGTTPDGHPTITDTDMMEQLAQEMARSVGQEPAAGWRAAFVAEIPLGRPMDPGEIAGLCAFLAGDGAAAISGQRSTCPVCTKCTDLPVDSQFAMVLWFAEWTT
jgi:NAD(P)-dependent dehydrogenase (short-subunit alcohol dehydrogenase family)